MFWNVACEATCCASKAIDVAMTDFILERICMKRVVNEAISGRVKRTKANGPRQEGLVWRRVPRFSTLRYYSV